MQIIIDRLENELAAIETKHEMVWINRPELPAAAREGDLVIKQAGVWAIDKQASILRKNK